MINYLCGKVMRKEDLSITLLINSGVGYEVFIPIPYHSNLNLDQEVKLEISHIQKEDGRETLYGFYTLEEKKCFESLLTVDGIGDKKAFSIFIPLNPIDLIKIIKEKNLNELKKVKGIGPKVAEKIIEKLNGKIEATIENPVFRDLRESLAVLGRQTKDINNFIATLDNTKTYDLKELIKLALK